MLQDLPTGDLGPRALALNIVRNATERAARLASRTGPRDETSFPGTVPIQYDPVALSASHSTAYRSSFPYFFPPSPTPEDLRVILGLPKLPALFGGGGGGGGAGGTPAAQGLPPALVNPPDPSKGPVSVSLGAVQATNLSAPGQSHGTKAPPPDVRHLCPRTSVIEDCQSKLRSGKRLKGLRPRHPSMKE